MSKQGENGRIERFEKEWQIDNRVLVPCIFKIDKMI
jgi:hypothetical protein